MPGMKEVMLFNSRMFFSLVVCAILNYLSQGIAIAGCFMFYASANIFLLFISSLNQEFASLHPSDQDRLQDILEKDAITRYVLPYIMSLK